MSLPFISIIIPAFNAEETILTAFKSILGQTFPDFEIILVDGLSSDSTVKMVEELNDSRIKIYSEKDKGTYDAMNKGINYAKGEWLYFIGGDDYLYDSNVLQTLSKKLKRQKNMFLRQCIDKRRYRLGNRWTDLQRKIFFSKTIEIQYLPSKYVL